MMDLRTGVVWAYRLILNREPESEAAIDHHVAICRNVEELRAMFFGSGEFADQLANAMRPREQPRFPVDLREGVRWAFRLILGREPKEEDVEFGASHLLTIGDIRRGFALSREFELRGGNARSMIAAEVLNNFAPSSDRAAPEDSFRDFLGSVTRVSFLPPEYVRKAGHADNHPAESGIHGIPEWVGTLRSVLEARERVVAVELGAGWAPWLVSVAAAAKRIGIENVYLVGVEGSRDHFEYMTQHFIDNGLKPEDHELLHAVVGEVDGIARFPKLASANEDYGASAAFSAADEASARFRGELEEIRCVGLSSLVDRLGQVDLIHIDIQGHEQAVLSSAVETLNRNVRRIVVGTHSRAIEAALLDLFTTNGWINEYEQPCQLRQADDLSMHLFVDGEQVWRNGRFA
jgi:FkbM family methyltransferase